MEINNVILVNNVISYLIIYSFLGWVVESLYKTIRQRKLVNSGFLYGPLCPIYGFGAIIMLIFLRDLKNNVPLLFVAAFFILSIWEYIVAIVLEKLFKTKYWDYSDYKYNIHGRVCLLNSFFWGILAVVFIEFVHPPIRNLVSEVSGNIQMYANISLFVLMIIDLIFSIIKVYNINLSLETMENLAKNIKAQLEKIKNYAGTKAKESETLEKMQTVLDELKQKQEALKVKLQKQTDRFRKAFPTMKSEKLTKILNDKIDYIRRKK